jgi:hypothetical protein
MPEPEEEEPSPFGKLVNLVLSSVFYTVVIGLVIMALRGLFSW